MFAIAGIILLAIVALAILHVLFSPWLLLVAVGILAWLKFRPRRTQR